MRIALLALVFLGGAADDELLAAVKRKLGCDERCKILSVDRVQVRSGKSDLAVRTRRTGHCGTIADWTLLDAQMKLLLTVEEEVDRACGPAPEEHRRTPVSIAGEVVRAGEHSWKWNGEKFVAR
jgi:hypothetical protein